MPDPVLVLEAMGIAAVAAALIALLFENVPRRARPAPARSSCGWVLGLGLGTWLGAFVLGLRPRWPLSEDLDRFLGLVLPAFLGVEIVVSTLRWPPLPRWLARALVAVLTAPTLLHGSSYLSDVAGPGTREWSPVSSVLILGGLAVALLVEWLAADAASRRGYTGTTLLALTVSTGAAAVALLLSGYASGGQMGLPLAAALAGLAVAMPFVPERSRREVPVGPGLGGLFGLLVIGHFFAALTTPHAVLLFLAPLLGTVAMLLLPRQASMRLRSAACATVVALVAGVVLVSAGAKFSASSRSPASASGPSLEDYSGLESKSIAPNVREASPASAGPSPDSLDPVSP